VDAVPSGIAVKGLRRVTIIYICDFQAASEWDGIKILDFEPNFLARQFLQPKQYRNGRRLASGALSSLTIGHHSRMYWRASSAERCLDFLEMQYFLTIRLISAPGRPWVVIRYLGPRIGILAPQ
jgi:hypothetical protein